MNFLNNLKEGTVLQIENREFTVLAMNYYATENNVENWYAKILLNDNHCLCIDPTNSKTLDFGYEVKAFAKGEKFPKVVSFNGNKYKLAEKDYQIVINHIFGDSLAMEGECLFTNHINETNEGETISMGYLPRTKSRADMYLKNIAFKDVKIINKNRA